MANSKATVRFTIMPAFIAVLLIMSTEELGGRGAMAAYASSSFPDFVLGRKVLEEAVKYEPNGRSGYNSYGTTGRSGYNSYGTTGRGGYN